MGLERCGCRWSFLSGPMLTLPCSFWPHLVLPRISLRGTCSPSFSLKAQQSPILAVGVRAVSGTGRAAGLKGSPVCDPGAGCTPGAQGQWRHCHRDALPGGVWRWLLRGRAALCSMRISVMASAVGQLSEPPLLSSSLFLVSLLPPVPPLRLCCSAGGFSSSPAPLGSLLTFLSFISSLGGPCCIPAVLFLHGLSPFLPQGPISLLHLGTVLEHPECWAADVVLSRDRRVLLHARVDVCFAVGSHECYRPCVFSARSLPAGFVDVAAEAIRQVCIYHQQKVQYLMSWFLLLRFR